MKHYKKHYFSHHHRLLMKLIRSIIYINLLLYNNIIKCQNDYYDDIISNVGSNFIGDNNHNNNNNQIHNHNDDIMMMHGSQQQLANDNNNNNNNDIITSSTKLDSLDVICGKEYMTVRAEFNGPFNGIIFSKGTYGQSKCVYVKPYSGLTHTTFNVRYDECGTKPDLQGKYFENTIVIQYGTDIIEAYDEAKRLRCEWFEAYEKPATFRPAIPVADLDIIEMNFQGDEIDCWMSIQEGKGPWSNEINRIVTVGQPLTIVVAINDKKNQFDMKVKSCFAHDGIKAPIYLIDEDGCILRSKMISPFQKIRGFNGKASLISYAQFLAFKFPDSVDVQIQCTVEVCRHGCIDTCSDGISGNPQQPRHQQQQQDHHRNDFHNNNKNENIFNIENNVTSHRFIMDNKDDLLESADSIKQPITLLNLQSSTNDNDNDDDDDNQNNNIHHMNTIDDHNGHDDDGQENNYLDVLADYLHNVEYNNNKEKITHNDYQIESVHHESVSNNRNNNRPTMMTTTPTMPPHQPTNYQMPSMKNNIKPPPPPPPPSPSLKSQLPPSKQYPIPLKNIGEPVAQIMAIPLSPIYPMPMPLTMASLTPNMNPYLPQHIQKPHQSTKSNGIVGSLLNPLKLFTNNNNHHHNNNGNKKYIPNILSNYFHHKRNHNHQQQQPSPSSATIMSMNIPNDNFELILNNPTLLPSQTINNNRLFRRQRRYINDKQGEIGLKKGFQVVTALDLSFSPNISQDMTQIYEGKPESIVYGLCISTAYFIYAITTAITFLFSAIFVSIFIVFKLERIKIAKKHMNGC